MNLFLDRNRTLLPRIDVVFLLTRIMTFASVLWFAIYGDHQPADTTFFYVVVVSYALLIGLFLAGMYGRFDLKLAYFSSIVYDIIFLPLFIWFTGGLASSFFLFFFPTISVAAYVLVFPAALAAAILLTVPHVILVASQLGAPAILGLSVRLGLMWIYFLGLAYVSEYMRKSERRLMKLFNTLNLRTSELEKSQAQLEMIYENTRVLAAILEPDDVVREVMTIMGSTLGYSTYVMILKNSSGHYYYRARCINGRTSYSLRALSLTRNELLMRAAFAQEVVRLNDTTTREDYEMLTPETRAAIVIPMILHGQVTGLLIAESTETGHFSQRDEQLLAVVARSAGLAIENAELLKRTEELTILDELTESYNYRYFIKKFQEEKRRAVRYHLPLSIIMFDIDWFKKLNDGYGHEAGNVVLRQLARVTKECIRDVDIFARYGGEEFVVILPQTPLHEAQRIGERIRTQVEQTVIDTGATGKVKITVSIGVSSYPENGRSEEELVSIADQALYKAKGSGKNLVCVS